MSSESGMVVKIGVDGSIFLSGNDTGLKVSQSPKGTIVYTAEAPFRGQKYQEHQMPQNRYSMSHPDPGGGVAGVHEFVKDITTLLGRLRAASKASR